MASDTPANVIRELYGEHVEPYFVEFVPKSKMVDYTDCALVDRIERWSFEGDDSGGEYLYHNRDADEWGDYDALSQWEESFYYNYDDWSDDDEDDDTDV